jgi:hypothetical protein
LDRDIGIRLTLLTFLILTLIGVLIVYTGLQAVTTERRFFRDLTFEANLAVSRMVARELIQVFTNVTGLVEDLAHFPAVIARDPANSAYLFELIIRRHPIVRTLYLVDPGGQTVVTRHGIGTRSPKDYRPLSAAERATMSRPGGNYYVSPRPYFLPSRAQGDSPLAMTYAVRLEDRSHEFTGILAAELEMDWIAEVLEVVQVGHTGQLVVVCRAADGRPSAIYSTRNMTRSDLEDFHATFPVERAYGQELVGVEYEGVRPKMASFATRHGGAVDRPDVLVGQIRPFPVAVTPERIPDWLVVVQQYTEEGLMVAERMKWNVIVLVIVGLTGLLIIAKLWIDSLTV